MIVDLGTVAAVAGGTMTITSTYSLPTGLGWFGIVAQGGAPSVRADSGNRQTPFASTGQTNPAGSSSGEVSAYVDGITGALPGTFGVASIDTTIVPMFYYQIS